MATTTFETLAQRAAVLCLSTALAGLARERSAWAASGHDDGVALAWSAPAECPGPDVVLEALRAWTGGRNPRRRLSATARVEHADGRLRVSLTLTSHDGEETRSFDAASCEEVTRAVTAILAVATGDTRPPAPPPTPAPEALPPPPASAPHAAWTASPWAIDATASAAGTLDDGPLPSAAAGGRIAAGARFRRSGWTLRLEAFASYAPGGSRATLASSPSHGADFSLLAVGARACAAWTLGPLELGPCAGGEADLASARAFGGTFDPGGQGAWGAAAAGGGAWWPLAPFFALSLGADALLAPQRPSFVIGLGDGEQGLHTPAAVSIRAMLGAEVRFF